MSMNYTFTKIRKGIILVEADSQYALCSMFLRPQEFYESPYDNIRGKHFYLEEYMDTYAKDRGNFSYYTDWCGFNIPSESFKEFVNLFQYNMSAKENLLVSSIRNLIPNLEGRFYIIGACKEKNNKETIEHEMAHAYWYIDSIYKSKMIQLIEKMPISWYESAFYSLKLVGYSDNFIEDEMQAYLATASRQKIIDMFGWKNYINIKVPSSFKKYFKQYYKAHK